MVRPQSCIKTFNISSGKYGNCNLCVIGINTHNLKLYLLHVYRFNPIFFHIYHFVNKRFYTSNNTKEGISRTESVKFD